MKILLIAPKFRFHTLHPPLGLGYIAAVLEREGHQVKLLDCNTDKLPGYGVGKIIDVEKPDLIGISVLTGSYNSAKRLLKEIKPATDTPVVLGGAHITALPEFSLKDTGADFCVISEGEITVKELAERMESGATDFNNIKGLAYMDNGAIRVNEPRELIEDIDSLPFPAWHLMPPEKYHIAPVLASSDRYPLAPVMSTRGCPYMCRYCASHITWRRKLRLRSPEKVVDEIEMLMNDFGVKSIHFADDNFTFYRTHAAAVCNEIIERKLDITWGCPNGVRADRVDKELLLLMKKAGCNMLSFGIESGSQQILKNIKKALALPKVPSVIKNAKENGITTFGFFVLGLPGETRDTIRETIDFSKNAALDRAWFFIFAPLPGSELFDEWVKDKNLSEIDWDLLDTYTGIVGGKDLSKEDLESFQKEAVREFYLRPKMILSILRRMRFENYKTLATWIRNRVSGSYL
ncbi:MAG: radical SAM protein [Candidatus Methanoperedens sp.]|nr:radical SAM protein [Candidatus Methanoperedens sp.]